MIISTNETKTFESELYISFRKADSTWMVPPKPRAADQ